MSKNKTPSLATLRAAAEETQNPEQPEVETPAETPTEQPAETPTEETSAETPAETPTEQPAASAALNPVAGEMVSISATELGTLRAAQTELNLMKPQFATLEKWHKNMSAAGATGGQDASEASPTKARVSKATQRAIDMKNAK